MRKCPRPPERTAVGAVLVLRYGHACVDIAACGLGVGAGLVGGVGKRLCVLLIQAGDGDLKLHADEESFGIVVDGRACAGRMLQFPIQIVFAK